MKLIVRNLGKQSYATSHEKMRAFTDNRDQSTDDELWLLEHPAVFTQGQAGKASHILSTTQIPVIQSDRGGQVTYHGPGQWIGYCLIDLRRKKISIRSLVRRIEQVIIHCLADYDISATTRCDAPGVYVDNKKIASLGLRVRAGCCYHGFALNVNMDLSPFKQINPCGMPSLQMTQLSEYLDDINKQALKAALITHFKKQLDYN